METETKMNVLVIDVGGSHVKILVTGQSEERRIDSGPTMTGEQMIQGVLQLAEGWKFEAVSMGYPGVVRDHRPVTEPHNLGRGWVGVDYEAGFGHPVRIVNDAAMQALGSFRKDKLLFLGLGTGLGTSMVVGGTALPMEVGHLPYLDSTFEDYVGEHALERDGKKQWRKHVEDVVARLIAALQPDDVVIGGGNVKHLSELPAGCRAGDNANAFVGGFRLWNPAAKAEAATAA
jgi:polyphosphate glucokinase